uniref:RING-type domain-containing protein n=1 Tax=Panagrellus redivivus TaxID=6233 RepID=A0A7E4WAY6_PANRE
MESVSSNNTYGYTSSAMWEHERKVREAAVSPVGGNSISLGDADAREYLPQFIVRRFGDELPVMADGCSLRAKLKPDEGVLKYRYTVSWFEDGPIHQEIEKRKLDAKVLKKASVPKAKASSVGDCTKSSKSRCCEGDTSKLPTTTASEYATIQSHEVNVELAKAHENSVPNVRLCDGPCGAMRSVADLRILGRCDHAICTLCVVNAPMIPQEDGSMGCCNKRCFAADIISRIPDEKRKHQLYQVLFNGKNWEPIFKLYTGDARRSAMPRRDASLYSSASSRNVSSSKSASFVSSACGSSSTAPSNSAVTPLTTQSGLARYQASSAPSGSSTSTSSKSYSSLTDASSQYSELRFANEMLMLNLIVLESSYFSTIKRHRFEQEVSAKTPFFDAVEALMGSSASRNLFNKQTRIFYCTTDTFNPAAILEVDVSKYGKLPINVFANNLGVASFLIDYTNKIVKGSRPLYKPPGVIKA